MELGIHLPDGEGKIWKCPKCHEMVLKTRGLPLFCIECEEDMEFMGIKEFIGINSRIIRNRISIQNGTLWECPKCHESIPNIRGLPLFCIECIENIEFTEDVKFLGANSQILHGKRSIQNGNLWVCPRCQLMIAQIPEKTHTQTTRPRVITKRSRGFNEILNPKLIEKM